VSWWKLFPSGPLRRPGTRCGACRGKVRVALRTSLLSWAGGLLGLVAGELVAIKLVGMKDQTLVLLIGLGSFLLGSLLLAGLHVRLVPDPTGGGFTTAGGG
jgi:hypothetical protein